MRRVQGSKTIICTKKEIEMMYDICWGVGGNYFFELPLFSMTPQPKILSEIKTEYVLIRRNNKKLTQTFFDRINKAWNKMYEG